MEDKDFEKYHKEKPLKSKSQTIIEGKLIYGNYNEKLDNGSKIQDS
jgi:hypothetical protein